MRDLDLKAAGAQALCANDIDRMISNLKQGGLSKETLIMSKLLGCKRFLKVIVGLLLGSGLVLLTGCGEKKVPVSVIGWNHTDKGILGYGVYDDKGNSAGGLFLVAGGGDSKNCCAMIPEKWYPELKVKVRWTYNANEKKGIAQTTHTAEIPIQKYYPYQAGMLHLHFYPDDTVKAIVTTFYPESPFYPMSKKDLFPWAVDKYVLGNYLREGSQLLCDFQQSPDDFTWAKQWTDKEFPKCTEKRSSK